MISDDKSGTNSRRKIPGLRISVIAICVVFLAIGLGYWFAYRPHTAITHCRIVATERAGITDDNWAERAYNTKVQVNYMFMYETCMQAKGLKG